MKRVARPLVTALNRFAGTAILGHCLWPASGQAPDTLVQRVPFSAPTTAGPLPQVLCPVGCQAGGAATTPARTRCARRSASRPTSWRPRPTASIAPAARSRCGSPTSPFKSATAHARCVRDVAGAADGRSGGERDLGLDASQRAAADRCHARLGAACVSASRLCKAGVVQGQPQAGRGGHEASPAKAQSINIAYHRDLPKWQPMLGHRHARCSAIFDGRRLGHDPARLSPTPSSSAAHLRHGRRLLGLAAARRWSRRPRGRRHQRRHLRAVEGDHAQRRGDAPLQVGRRRQHRRQRAGLRGRARCVHQAPIFWPAARIFAACRTGAGGTRPLRRAARMAASAPRLKVVDRELRARGGMPVTGLATTRFCTRHGESQIVTGRSSACRCRHRHAAGAMPRN